MTDFNAVTYILSLPLKKQKNGSDIIALLEKAINTKYPMQDLKRLEYLSLAGSNGKTCCAVMLSSVLKEAGYTVGTLRMPICEETPWESILIDGSPISRKELASLIDTLRSIIKEQELSLCRAELMLAAAMLCFFNKKCSLCLIEGDMSGHDAQLDYPIDPMATLICGTIPVENEAELKKIRAYVRRGVDIICAPQDGAFKAAEQILAFGNKGFYHNKALFELDMLTRMKTIFTYDSITYSLNACGGFQAYNALLVILTCKFLCKHKFNISDAHIRTALTSLKANKELSCKAEVLSLSPLIIADSAHDDTAIGTVCALLSELTPHRSVRLCLPCELIEKYRAALISVGFAVEEIFTLSDDTAPVGVTACATPIALSKKLLLKLPRDTVLLISGDAIFARSMEKQVRNRLGF